MMSWNPCMSWMIEPSAMPSAAKTMATRAMRPRASGTAATWSGRNPAPRHTANTSRPWMTATVAPPSVRPIMISRRGTGATSVSFRKPNCRSHSIAMPEKTDVNRMVMAITPGAMNCR